MHKLLIALHLIGASIWIGGHMVLSLVVIPRALRSRNPAVVLDFEAGFEPLGLSALFVQILTGLWLAHIWLPETAAWFRLDSQISWLITTKLILLAITISLAIHARLRVIPQLRPQTLGYLAYHVFLVTLISMLFLIVGVGIRTGGLF